MLDVRRSPELTAAILALRDAERAVRLDINKDARRRLGPIWQEAILGRTTTRLEIRVLRPGARVAVGVRQVSLKAATSKRPLAGGLVPADRWHAVEFGAHPRPRKFETTSSKGNRFTVTRIVGRQFRARSKQGYVVMDAASETVTKLISIWLVTIVDNFRSFADVERR